MVDAERIGARLDRLEALIERLEGTRGRGEDAYLADEMVRAGTERRLQLALQACIDIGAQLVSELSIEPPSSYAEIFERIAEAGHLDDALAGRLAAAARQRNLLVHLYLDVDDRQIFAALGRLDDLRAFAAAAERLAGEG